MKRSPFRQKGVERRPAKTITGYTPRARPVAVASGEARMSVPIPKPPPCKPGKRTPTAAEREWMTAITALGCIACILDGHQFTPGAVHHLLRGGRRMGHLFTICLCDPGHHKDGAGKVSRHPYKARFEERYGSEDSLLGRTQALVGMKAR